MLIKVKVLILLLVRGLYLSVDMTCSCESKDSYDKGKVVVIALML